MHKKHNIVYQTDNLVNGKFYIGMHSTDDINDGYIGSGKLLWRAVAKYGIESFRRKVLADFATRQEASDYEAMLVDREMVLNPNCYNVTVGGANARVYYGHNNPFYGRKHSPEAIAKILAKVTGFRMNEDQRRKISKSSSERWACPIYRDRVIANRRKPRGQYKTLKHSPISHVVAWRRIQMQEKIKKNNERFAEFTRAWNSEAETKKKRSASNSRRTTAEFSAEAKKRMGESNRKKIGKIFIRNIEWGFTILHDPADPIPAGFVRGYAPRGTKYAFARNWNATPTVTMKIYASKLKEFIVKHPEFEVLA